MNDKLYIVFAENTGKDDSGNYFYRLLFSKSPEIVWGDNFNETPAAIIPDLEPDSSSIDKEYLLTTKLHFETAVESTWFSIQDCIDGIIALMFYVGNEKSISVNFGMEFDEFNKYISSIGGELKEVEYIPRKKEENGEEES